MPTFEGLKHVAEFPAANSRATFTLQATLTDGYYNESKPKINLGCHIALLSNMYLKLDARSISSLDGTKKKKSEFNEYLETSFLYSHIAKYEMPEEEKERIWATILEHFEMEPDAENPRGFTYVVMSDNMNSYSKTFPNNSGIAIPDVLPRFKTSDFVNWLIKNKHGVVTASPIGRNQYHQSSGKNYSMTQAFIWMPPHFCPTAAPGTAFHSNLAALPDEAAWRDMTARKAGHKNNDSLDDKIWRDGKSLINRTDVLG
jgi:hypothetical protein